MHFLILSILASVSVAVLLKMARQRGLSIEQMVAMNYVIATALTVLVLQPQTSSLHFSGSQIVLFGSLGILLPSIFIAMGCAVTTAGIVKSDAAQRLSLFLPVLAAFTLFGETVLPHRLVGLILAILALIAVLYKPQNHATTTGEHGAAKWLLAVWFGYGVIDILFKQLSKQGTAFSGSLLVVFMLSGVLMFTYLFWKKTAWQKQNLLVGILLGCMNFMNILFYIKAHQAFKDSPTLVFAGMNMGVIVLGTLIGAIAFKEKISKFNFAGVILALAAIIMLYFGQNLF
ncbi:MAG: EamA/RhaT family transporter [Alysiella sp.]|uniref:EamA/RhaT family transporter n=1 Tax=Alysiella sp. TaxID=1872483 RepID=UPI0026DBF915|nr:EamA/RhaT family transporter [Alysiella sp.]MDO4434451.1 EamA/RhaT family transporter [Alysiella sp.]